MMPTPKIKCVDFECTKLCPKCTVTCGLYSNCHYCCKAHSCEGAEMDRTKHKTVVEYHAEICDSIKDLYKRKNADYGDSFAETRRTVPYSTLIRLSDKFYRYKTLTLNGNSSKVADEKIEDTLLDLANYAIMELAERKAEKDGAADD